MRRLVFGDGLPLADAVYGGGGGEGQAAHAVAAHAFEHVIGAEGVLPEIFVGGVSGNEFDVGIGGQVVYHLDSAHGGFQSTLVQQVAFDEMEAGTADQVGDVFPLAAAQIVDDCDLAAAGPEPMQPAPPVTSAWGVMAGEGLGRVLEDPRRPGGPPHWRRAAPAC